MCLSHLHPLGSMFFNLISQPGLCVACLSAVASQGQILLQRSEQKHHSSWYSITAQPLSLHIRPLCSAKHPVEPLSVCSYASQLQTYPHTNTLLTLLHTHYHWQRMDIMLGEARSQQWGVSEGVNEGEWLRLSLK